jgi:hypothetical protein
MTVEELIAQLRAVNGFVIAVTDEKGNSRCVALLPQKRVISPLMFSQLKMRGVLKGVTKKTLNGETTRTYRIV